jgi:hypothetical protein
MEISKSTTLFFLPSSQTHDIECTHRNIQTLYQDIDRQTDRQTHKQTGRQADRHPHHEKENGLTINRKFKLLL